MTNYKTIQALSKDTHRAAEGTLAFVAEKGGELYVKARNGWRKVQVCQLFHPDLRILSGKQRWQISCETDSVFFQLGELISHGPPTSAASQSLSRSGEWKPQRVHSQVQTLLPTKSPNDCDKTLSISLVCTKKNMSENNTIKPLRLWCAHTRKMLLNLRFL